MGSSLGIHLAGSVGYTPEVYSTFCAGFSAHELCRCGRPVPSYVYACWDVTVQGQRSSCDNDVPCDTWAGPAGLWKRSEDLNMGRENLVCGKFFYYQTYKK